MLPEKGEEAYPCGQGDGMVTDMVLHADDHGENHGEQEQYDIDRERPEAIEDHPGQGSDDFLNGRSPDGNAIGNWVETVKSLLFDAGIGGAHRSALGFVKMVFAFHAEGGIDHVVLIALGNRLDRTNRFASTAADAGIINN